jgi:hypothetical protein
LVDRFPKGCVACVGGKKIALISGDFTALLDCPENGAGIFLSPTIDNTVEPVEMQRAEMQYLPKCKPFSSTNDFSIQIPL